MKGKIILLCSLVLVLLLVHIFRVSSTGDNSVADEVSVRYLVCGNCPAQYEIPDDYFALISPSDMHREGAVVHFRCRECGELAAEPGMIIVMDGEVVGISGAEYDETRGLDEI